MFMFIFYPKRDQYFAWSLIRSSTRCVINEELHFSTNQQPQYRCWCFYTNTTATTHVSISLLQSKLFSYDQAALRTLLSIRVSPSVTHFLLCPHYRIIMKFSGVVTNGRSDAHAKGQGQRYKVKGMEWCTKLDLIQKKCPIVFPRSSVKFQGHVGQKIPNCDLNWGFPDSNSSLNSRMALKRCTKLHVVLIRCPIVFCGHPSSFQTTWTKNGRLKSILSKISRPVAAIKSLRFALF